jgi:hypothetical protein
LTGGDRWAILYLYKESTTKEQDMNTDTRPVIRMRPANGKSLRASDMPSAPVYVAMTDRFMSGWGCAEGLTNRHVILCDDYTEAVAIAERAEARPEMLRVSILTTKPRTRPGVLYSWANPEGWLRG